jgi:hypothetical protein
MTSSALSKTGLSSLDQDLIRHAASGKSPAEIGALLNIPAPQVQLRTKEILLSRDVWTERERFLLFLQDIYELKDLLTVQVKASLDPKDTSNLIRILEQLGKTLQSVSKANKDIADTVSESQAKFMLELIVRAFDYAEDQLANKHPDLPWAEINSTFREGLAYVVTNDDDNV